MDKIIQMNYRMWLFSLLIIPFIQGGYFNYSVMLFGVIQTVILLILLFTRQARLRVKGIRILLMCMFVVSLLASASAIDRGMQPFGILRMLIPILTIIIYDSYKAVYSNIIHKHIGRVFILGGGLMSFSVLIAVTVFSMEHPIASFFIQNNRLGGFFQYANTFAVYLFGILSLVVFLKIHKHLRKGLLLLFSLTIVATQSRSVLFILFIYTLALIIFSEKKRKDSVYIFAGILLGQVFLQVILTQFQAYRSFDLGAGEFQSRLLYYEDGLRMIGHKLTGYGYMGYYYVQRFFQTGASYRVRFIHSSILQASLDYGILAGGLLIAQFLYWLKRIYRSFWEKNLDKTLALIGLAGYFIHSFIDFDFQFIAYVIFLYVYFVIVEERDQEEGYQEHADQEQTDQGQLKGTLIILTCIFLLMYSYFLLPATYEYQGDYVNALNIYPYYTKAMTGRIQSQKQDEQELVEAAKRFIDQNKYYYEGFAFLREYYYNNGDLKKSLFYSYSCKELAPLWIRNYERHVDIIYAILHGRYEDGVLSTQDKLFYELFSIHNELDRLKMERSNSYNIRHKAQFSLTPKMTRKIGMAYQLYEAAMK